MMAKDAVLLLLLTLACAKKTVIEKTEGIFILNEKNYDKAVKEFDHLLVYFYAPWFVISFKSTNLFNPSYHLDQVWALQGSGPGVCEGWPAAQGARQSYQAWQGLQHQYHLCQQHWCHLFK